MDEQEFEYKTLIIKFTERLENGLIKEFICNRGQHYFKGVYNDRYIRWFENDDLAKMNELNCDFEILYTLDIDNTGRQSQKEINKIKKSLIKKYNAQNEDNDSKLLCNAMLNNAVKKFRKVYKDNYNTVIATISKMLEGEISNCVDDIWKEHNLYKLEKKYMIFDNPDIDMQHKAVMIVFKEYINERRKSIQLNDGKVKFPELSFDPVYGHYYRLVNQINSIRNKAIDFGRSKKRKKSKSYIL